jgi:hypothetical protein
MPLRELGSGSFTSWLLPSLLLVSCSFPEFTFTEDSSLGIGGELNAAGGPGDDSPLGGSPQVSHLCDPGEHHCDGADLVVCNERRNDWDYVDTCVTSGLCDAVARECKSPACDAGELSCDGDALLECNPARTKFVSKETCRGENVECDAFATACIGPSVVFSCTAEHDDRWVHITDTSFNVQGYLYDSHAGASAITAVDTCGKTLALTGTSKAGTWGAEAGLLLCQEGAGDPSPGAVHSISTCPLGGDQAKVRGVRFKLCAGTYPPELRVNFVESAATDGYTPLSPPVVGETYEVYMADARAWADTAGGQRFTNPDDVEAISFWVPPAGASDVSYHLCITDIELLGEL